MTPTEPHAPIETPVQTGQRKSWLRKCLGWLLAAVGFIFRFLLIAWGSLALYYSNLPSASFRLTLAVMFLAFGIWALWLSRWHWRFPAFALAYLALLAFWATIKPTHDRHWRPEVAVMPRATIDGDRVRISGFRNFEYRSADDFTVHYEDREFLLSHLTSMDFFLSFWAEGPVGHTFVSFNFDNAPPLCISIETRPEVGEGFDPIASLFKQFELIYVVGDERDLVRVRTNYRNENVFLYHMRISPEHARQFLLVYLERINELADHPEFYHLLTNNCTINIIRYANRVGRVGGLDFRHVLNGLIDRYLYITGVMDTSLPFAELRQRSWINKAAQTADQDVDFSEHIRADLPPRGS